MNNRDAEDLIGKLDKLVKEMADRLERSNFAHRFFFESCRFCDLPYNKLYEDYETHMKTKHPKEWKMKGFI